MKSRVHVHTPTKLTTWEPLMVHTLVVADVIATVSPGAAVASTGPYVGPFTVALAGALDCTVITLLAFETTKFDDGRLCSVPSIAVKV